MAERLELFDAQINPAEMLAVEFNQFSDATLKTLVPRVIGQTAEAEDRKRSTLPRAKRQWDERSFFAELDAAHGPELATVARHLLEWARPQATRIFWGSGQYNGTFIPVIERDGGRHFVFTVYNGGRGLKPTVEIPFQYWQGRPPFDDESKRRSMLTKLNQIPGVRLDEDALTRRPSIPISALGDPALRSQFLEVMQTYIDAVKATA